MAQPHLPAGFTFTQTALRTYLECPYRFRLRYLEGVPWPALPPGPSGEAALERGQRFHELARQHFLGLDVAGQAGAAGAEIARWWAGLLAVPPDLARYPQRYPEAGLSIPLGEFRLAARYDLLAVGDDAAIVVDWKTGRALPPAAVLAEDIQTRVYLYVLAEGGAAYCAGRPFAPGALGIVYWHPEGPRQVHLPYDHDRHRADRALLELLVAEVAGRPAEEMLPTRDAAACGRCAHAPLCGRRVTAEVEWEPEEEASPEEEVIDLPG